MSIVNEEVKTPRKKRKTNKIPKAAKKKTAKKYSWRRTNEESTPTAPIFAGGQRNTPTKEIKVSGNEIRIPYKTVRMGEGHLIFTI